MISYEYVVSDRQGLHATNAMSLCRAAGEYKSIITLKSRKGKADCKNVLSLMSLGIRQGECLELTVEGEDETQAAGFLKGLLRTIL
ncbi:MAG: HPr family phosphocarrier protein [Clostridium sp.]|nr:HPr family phosphocarrier protein [Clostridium sp.]